MLLLPLVVTALVALVLNYVWLAASHCWWALISILLVLVSYLVCCSVHWVRLIFSHFGPVGDLNTTLIKGAILLDGPIQGLQHNILMVGRPLLINHWLFPLVGCDPKHFLAADLVITNFWVGSLRSHLLLSVALRVFQIHIVHHLWANWLKVLGIVTWPVNCIRWDLSWPCSLIISPIISLLSNEIPILAGLFEMPDSIFELPLLPG